MGKSITHSKGAVKMSDNTPSAGKTYQSGDCEGCPFFKNQRNLIRRNNDCSYYECSISEAVQYACRMKKPDQDSEELRIRLKRQDRSAFWVFLLVALPLAFLDLPVGGFLIPLIIVLAGHGFVFPLFRKIRAKKQQKTTD
jgi:hypothetical protein